MTGSMKQKQTKNSPRLIRFIRFVRRGYSLKEAWGFSAVIGDRKPTDWEVEHGKTL